MNCADVRILPASGSAPAPQATTRAPTQATTQATTQPAGGGGGGACENIALEGNIWSSYTCADFTNVGDCAHAAVAKACCMCGGGSLLQEEKIRKEQRHKFRGARGSSMMEEWAQRDELDDLLVETDDS